MYVSLVLRSINYIFRYNFHNPAVTRHVRLFMCMQCYLLRAFEFCVLTESTNACCPSKKKLIWSSVLTSSVRTNQCINVFYCISSCQQLAEQNTIANSDIILWYFSFSFLSKVSNCVCFQAATNQSGWKQLITISLVLETIDLMDLLDVIFYIEQVCWYKYTRHNMLNFIILIITIIFKWNSKYLNFNRFILTTYFFCV